MSEEKTYTIDGKEYKESDNGANVGSGIVIIRYKFQ